MCACVFFTRGVKFNSKKKFNSKITLLFIIAQRAEDRKIAPALKIKCYYYQLSWMVCPVLE